jgi:hypothetical protein
LPTSPEVLPGKSESPTSPLLLADEIERLTQVIRGFNEAHTLSQESLRNLWAPKVQQTGTALEYIDRLLLLFVNHEFDYLSKLYSRCSEDYVFNELAQRKSVSIEVIKADYTRSQNYRCLLEKAGPGTLINMGSNVKSL